MPDLRGPRTPWAALVPVLILGGLTLLGSGCASSRAVSAPPPAPPSQVAPGGAEVGLASWYGEPYHGRLTASGERYDMHEMTAAHRTLPFGTRVRVTNRNNGRIAEVTITDRGPFVDGRIIDLSYAAADALGSLGDGVVPVRLDILELGEGMTAAACWEVQVGAFGRPDGIERARALLESKGYNVRLLPAGGGLTRVRVVTSGGRVEALRTAGELQRDFPGALAVPCGSIS